jgi:hypothetical protein
MTSLSILMLLDLASDHAYDQHGAAGVARLDRQLTYFSRLRIKAAIMTGVVFWPPGFLFPFSQGLTGFIMLLLEGRWLFDESFTDNFIFNYRTYN